LKHVTFKNSFIIASLILVGCGSSSRNDAPQVIDNPENIPPIINSSAVLTSSLDTEYNYTFSATDPNNDVITYSATVLPSWLSFDAATGVLSGTPIVNEVGKHSVTLIASDSEGEAQQTFTITVSEAPVVTAYEGYTGEYAGLTLLIDDRFDEFNSVQWIKSSHTFNVQGCYLEQQGVQFSEGIMSLVVDASDNAKGYYCGEIRSVDRYGYGRIEARIKSPKTEVASGYISSLFTYVFRPDGIHNDDTSAPIRWRELDIEMEGSRPEKFQANYIYGDGEWEWWKTRSWGAYEDKINIGPISDWKVYALEWTPEYIKWFVDGQLMKTLLPEDLIAGTHHGIDSIPHTIDAQIPEYAMGLYMNFWIPNDDVQDGFGGNKVDNIYPMHTEYDWFRYYSLDGYEEIIEGELPQEEVELEPVDANLFPDHLKIFTDGEEGFTPEQYNDGGTVTWSYVIEEDAAHGPVVEFNSSSTQQVSYLAADIGNVDLRAYEGGTITFDMKVVQQPSSDADWMLKVECHHPCQSVDLTLGSQADFPLDTWQPITVNIADLTGLDLSTVNNALVVFPAWGGSNGAIYRIDNVFWNKP
jgi:beta-glucanase (GH16 family)